MKYLKNIRLRYKAALVAAILLFVYVKGCSKGKQDAELNQPPVPGVLKADEVGQALINPSRHTITFVTRKGTSRRFLPDGPSKLTLKTNGEVVVTIPTWGFEMRPFIGIAVTDKLRLAVGTDLLYYQRWNLGLLAQVENKGPISAAFHVNYNVWQNVCLGVVLDNHKNPGLDLTLRF